ncbi:MAG: HDIG domain-containing protein [Bacteroidetes bacterium]|nr:HDIG domain-containing protein [Bacteroidota bacterium]
MSKFIDRSKALIKYLIVIAVIFLIYYTIPKEGKFKYEYAKNELWNHNDLISPFSFPIKKTAEQLDQEENDIRESFKPYYAHHNDILDNAIANIQINYEAIVEDANPQLKKGYIKLLTKLISETYDKGILEDSGQGDQKSTSGIIIIVKKNKSSTEVLVSSLFTLKKAREYVRDQIKKDTFLSSHVNYSQLLSLVAPNLHYDKNLSEAEFKSVLEDISTTEGVIMEGEKIISKGVKVTDDKFQILESLRLEYENQLSKGSFNYLKHLGYLLLLSLVIGGFIVYLWKFYREIYMKNKDVFLILFIITAFILLSTYVIKSTNFNIYLVPFCIVPIILISFFDARIAFISHLIVVVIVSLFSPNGYEFLLIQIIAGLAVVIVISQIRYLSQFFLATLIVLFVYYITFFGLKLIQVSTLKEIDFMNFLWFSGSFILTLLAYPLIYAFEKMFGFVSDITLIELSDLNKKLLRDLSSKAPGTFQHSIQVANLTDAVLNKIGGNSLLAKVGALYHDIGKMNAPQFFTENQKDINPHDNLDEKESARIIIKHVSDGVKLAKEHNLPREVISFIKTHHGTTKVEYFYRNYVKKNPDIQVDENDFRYPGPKPSSKEAAVVMIVDSIEAAARSIKEPSVEMLEDLVDRLVDYKMKDNQFENAFITHKEIKIAKEIIKKNLNSIYHSRIEYPSEN